jgi:hypothetical protein
MHALLSNSILATTPKSTRILMIRKQFLRVRSDFRRHLHDTDDL